MPDQPAPAVLRVPRVDQPLSLDDTRWDEMPAHALSLDEHNVSSGREPREPGQFRIAHDGETIFLKLELTDRDVVTLAKKDGDSLYQLGDVVEWFIGVAPGPQGPGRYLELHIAPTGVRSAYRFDRPGLLAPIAPEFAAEVAVDGTPNDLSTEDRGWSAQFALPHSAVKALYPAGAEGASEPVISVLVARYNYGQHMPFSKSGSGGPELTMWPAQPRTSFHLRPHHMPLSFE